MTNMSIYNTFEGNDIDKVSIRKRIRKPSSYEFDVDRLTISDRIRHMTNILRSGDWNGGIFSTKPKEDNTFVDYNDNRRYMTDLARHIAKIYHAPYIPSVSVNSEKLPSINKRGDFHLLYWTNLDTLNNIKGFFDPPEEYDPPITTNHETLVRKGSKNSRVNVFVLASMLGVFDEDTDVDAIHMIMLLREELVNFHGGRYRDILDYDVSGVEFITDKPIAGYTIKQLDYLKSRLKHNVKVFSFYPNKYACEPNNYTGKTTRRAYIQRTFYPDDYTEAVRKLQKDTRSLIMLNLKNTYITQSTDCEPYGDVPLTTYQNVIRSARMPREVQLTCDEKEHYRLKRARLQEQHRHHLNILDAEGTHHYQDSFSSVPSPPNSPHSTHLTHRVIATGCLIDVMETRTALAILGLSRESHPQVITESWLFNKLINLIPNLNYCVWSDDLETLYGMAVRPKTQTISEGIAGAFPKSTILPTPVASSMYKRNRMHRQWSAYLTARAIIRDAMLKLPLVKTSFTRSVKLYEYFYALNLSVRQGSYSRFFYQVLANEIYLQFGVTLVDDYDHDLYGLEYACIIGEG